MLSKRWKYLLVVIIICGLGWWVYSERIANHARAERRAEKASAEEAKRFNDWAYVAKEKEIAPGETVKLVIVPHPWGGGYMDTKCLIYTHAEFRQSSMICPDADRDNLVADDH